MKHNARLLLFENKIYSTEPNDPENDILGPDPMYYNLFSMFTDEQLTYVLKPEKATKDKLSAGNLLYIFDPIITEARRKVRKSQEKRGKRLYDLECARKVVTDDRYPVFISYVREFKRWTARRKTELMLGDYVIEFGRIRLIEMFKDIRYEPAIPELREVFLHDSDHRMSSEAISALEHIGTMKCISCISELLFHNEISQRQVYSLLSAAEELSHSSMVKGLKNVFSNYYYYHPSESISSEVYYGSTTQEKVLRAVSQVPTLEALELLELGIGHPFSHVERTAYKQIKKWVEIVLRRIKNGKDDGLGLRVMEVIKKYDLTTFSPSYNALKKSIKLISGS